MSRKNYRRIAEDLRVKMPTNENEKRGYLAAVAVIADKLKMENPRFDRERFFQALESA